MNEAELAKVRSLIQWANRRLVRIFMERQAEEEAFDRAWDQRAKEVAELEKLFKLGD